MPAPKKKPAARKRAAKKPAPEKRVTVEAAVERDLAQFPPELAGSALAASALALAREIDQAGNSATSKSMCARALTETLEKLRALAPAEKEADKLDDLARRRASRLEGKPKPARRARS